MLNRYSFRLFGAVSGAVLFTFLIGFFGPAFADASTATAMQKRGSETSLPIPRFVSLRGSEANARRGPSLNNRIDWVFTRRGMPLVVIGEYGHWRRVKDRDGKGGWVHFRLLSGVRQVIVDHDMLGLKAKPQEKSRINARLELGVIARLEKCTIDWCRISKDGYRGWVPKSAIWGVGKDEIKD